MSAKIPGWSLVPALFLGLCLAGAVPAPAAAAPSPPQPQILEASLAPRSAKILRRVALDYKPQMSPADRDRDCLQKIALAKRLLDVRKLVELRRETQALLPPGMEVSWEYFLRRQSEALLRRLLPRDLQRSREDGRVRGPRHVAGRTPQLESRLTNGQATSAGHRACAR